MLAAFAYPATIGASDSEQRLNFYQALAHNLTVSVRAIWFNEATSVEQKIEQLKWLNEIMHRVTSKIRVLRLGTPEWTESDSGEEIKHWVALCPSLEDEIEWAILTSHAAINYEHQGDR